MTNATDSERLIIEVSQELLKFKTAGQQLQMSHDMLSAVRDKSVELLEKSESLLQAVSVSFTDYSSQLQRQMDELLEEVRGVDLADFRGRLESNLAELSELIRSSSTEGQASVAKATQTLAGKNDMILAAYAKQEAGLLELATRTLQLQQKVDQGAQGSMDRDEASRKVLEELRPVAKETKQLATFAFFAALVSAILAAASMVL